MCVFVIALCRSSLFHLHYISLCLCLSVSLSCCIHRYTSEPWKSRGTFALSANSFLYRFSPSFERTDSILASPNNAIYDVSTFCMTFGGGYDWYVDNTCRTSTTNPSTYRIYSTTAYNSSWLAGSNRFTLDDVEVFYSLSNIHSFSCNACVFLPVSLLLFLV